MTDFTSHIDELRKSAIQGRLSRRQVLKRATVLGLSAPVIATLLAACGSDDDEPTESVAAPTVGSGSEATPTVGSDSEATPTVGSAADATPTEATSGDTSTPEPESDPTEPAEDDEPTPATESGSGTGRGAGGTLRILNWQAPTDLNPHYSQGYHNSAPAQMVLEPLLIIDSAGELIPILIDEVPSIENGGISEDRMAITFTLVEGLVWSDGTPLTSEDARFTWQWAIEEGASTTSLASFEFVSDVEVVDDRTFIVHFSQADPAWYNVFSRGLGLGSQILPQHMLEDHMGDRAPTAPFNLSPIGTGPYKVTDFRPGDVIFYEINENYRHADKPFFSSVEFKGGGDSASAARAVLQSGEADYAPNLQVEARILESMEEAGLGSVLLTWPGNVEHIFINFADPNLEVDGERAKLDNPHPFLSELGVRQALAMGCDRDTIATQLYGKTGEATANVITAPENFISPNTSFTFDVEQANQLLDEAGWTGSPRTKDGVIMNIVYQTSVNDLRQRTQDIVKQHWEELGATVELKAIDASVYFSADAGNPDTWTHFYADVEMATVTTNPFPAPLMRRWLSADPDVDIAQKVNGWTGRNFSRWVNEEFNELFAQVLEEFDPAVQAELFIAMNDLIIENQAVIPLVNRATPAAVATNLKGVEVTPWSEFTWSIADWYFEE